MLIANHALYTQKVNAYSTLSAHLGQQTPHPTAEKRTRGTRSF